MRFTPLLLAGVLLSGPAAAQAPAATQPTPEQAQQMMLQQMQMMAAMFDYRRSRLGFDETVGAVGAAMDRQGWKRGPVHDAQAAMVKAGMTDSKRMKVLEGCPAGFNEKLDKAGQGKLPPHPCRFTVFEGRDGKTYITRMNSGNIAKGLQGEAARLMAGIGADEEAILKGIAE